MSIKCLMNGLEVNYPCSPVCALFGDCVTEFDAQKKKNVRTNADRIRAMNDEELAKEMRSHAFALATCSEKAWLEWLQSPAE